MTNTKIISIGGWCRPAFQIKRHFLSRDGFQAMNGPFDWTVTSFAALQNCLSANFAPETMLDNDRLRISFAGSGMCATTGLIFHHAIGRKQLNDIGQFSVGQQLKVNAETVDLISVARERFIHTYLTLKSLRDHDGQIVFVRWQRQGHPDRRFAEAFEGENLATMTATLSEFLGHSGFRFLTVTSDITRGVTGPFADPVLEFETNGAGFNCRLQERMGWNGDQTSNFKGDDHSWSMALDRMVGALG
ncbi:MAG: hypothetical protein KC448_11660 [Yoonia sp.]|nr:hypothetical protein [Yoonia sp.]